MPEKVVLAYSGGLDTSCILKWLLEKNYEVICFIADVGQSEDFNLVQQKALNIGASEVVVMDLKEEFVKNYVWSSIQMGLIYEERYLLGTSLARPCITKGLMEVVKSRGAKYISHGATGKGNDQVRFEICAMALNPKIKIIAPWRDQEFCNRFQGRQDLIKYAQINNIPVSATPKTPWSMDANIMHISYESGILEDPNTSPPATLYQMTSDPLDAPQNPYRLLINFEKGIPVLVEDQQTGLKYVKPLDILKFLNKIGGLFYGIGRIDIVENRFVGLKSRGIYETPGATILFEAHKDLEIFCLDPQVYRLKTYLRDRMADFTYNGFWFSPEGNFIRHCTAKAAEHVTGNVTIEVLAGHVRVIGRDSKKMLYNQELVSMDVHGSYESSDATGFIAINALRIKEYCNTYGLNE